MNIETIMHQWELLAPAMVPPHNDQEYASLVANLDSVLDAGGADENHFLASLADFLGQLVSNYEDSHIEDPLPITGKQMFKMLMHQHSLKQSDFRDIGSQGVVSELQNDAKKRQLSVPQIRLLAKRFGISCNSFM